MSSVLTLRVFGLALAPFGLLLLFFGCFGSFVVRLALISSCFARFCLAWVAWGQSLSYFGRFYLVLGSSAPLWHILVQFLSSIVAFGLILCLFCLF